MTAQHTPGPWHALNRSDPEAIREHAFGPHIVGHDGAAFDWVATVQVSNTPEWAANARLITAAPDLLEALEEAQVSLDWFRRMALEGQNPRDFDPLAWSEVKRYSRKARAAIRKARGEDA